MKISLTAAFRNNEHYASVYRTCDLIFAMHGYNETQLAEIKELFPDKCVFLQHCTSSKELARFLIDGDKTGILSCALKEMETIKASLPKNQVIEVVTLHTINHELEPIKLRLNEN